jgi:hypothetical protein
VWLGLGLWGKIIRVKHVYTLLVGLFDKLVSSSIEARIKGITTEILSYQ